MKLFVSASILTLTAVCTAQLQTLSEIPDCAKPCAASLPAYCNLGVQCICTDQAFITSISCCIKKACSAADQQKTLHLAQQLCDTVKVTLPSAASCPASAGATGASSAATGASGTAAATGAMSNASGSAMSATSTTGASTGTGTGFPTSTKPSSSTSATAASGAAQVLGSNMGATGAAVAALALL